MKTHGEDVSSQSSKIKVSKNTESKISEEQKVLPKEEVKELSKPHITIVKPQTLPKQEVMPKVENPLRPTPYKRLNNLSHSNGDMYMMQRPLGKFLNFLFSNYEESLLCYKTEINLTAYVNF